MERDDDTSRTQLLVLRTQLAALRAQLSQGGDEEVISLSGNPLLAYVKITEDMRILPATLVLSSLHNKDWSVDELLAWSDLLEQNGYTRVLHVARMKDEHYAEYIGAEGYPEELAIILRECVLNIQIVSRRKYRLAAPNPSAVSTFVSSGDESSSEESYAAPDSPDLEPVEPSPPPPIPPKPKCSFINLNPFAPKIAPPPPQQQQQPPPPPPLTQNDNANEPTSRTRHRVTQTKTTTPEVNEARNKPLKRVPDSYGMHRWLGVGEITGKQNEIAQSDAPLNGGVKLGASPVNRGTKRTRRHAMQQTNNGVSEREFSYYEASGSDSETFRSDTEPVDKRTQQEHENEKSSEGEEEGEREDGELDRRGTGFAYTCHLFGCAKRFSTSNALRNHVSAKHADANKGIETGRRRMGTSYANARKTEDENPVVYPRPRGRPRIPRFQTVPIPSFNYNGIKDEAESSVEGMDEGEHLPINGNEDTDEDGLFLTSAESDAKNTGRRSGKEKTHPYACSFDNCKARFTKHSSVERHERTHTGEKPFECIHKSCGMRFSVKYHLTRHLRTVHRRSGLHQTETPKETTTETVDSENTATKDYVCGIDGCGKSFQKRHHLIRHTLIHTGEKPHRCTVKGCRKRFTSQWHLDSHLLSHTGEKPYACTYEGCDVRYSESTRLRWHMNMHAGKTPYVCRYEGCGRAFYGCSAQRKHEVREHGASLAEH